MTADAVDTAKKATRRRVLAMRDALPDAVRAGKVAAITRRLVALPAFLEAQTVAAYASFATEFDTAAFVSEVLATDKRLLLPRVERESRRIRFHYVSEPDGCLMPGPWGIREPDPLRCDAAEVTDIDFMLVPGVAFTPQCARLGYGGGFYDAAIVRLRPDAAKVAAAFKLQIVDALPMEAHDQRVDLVVTEDAEYGGLR